MEPQMADDLADIKSKVNELPALMCRMVEVTERQISQNEKLNDHIIRTDKRLEKMDTKIESNHSTILKWSGGIGAIVAVVGFVVMLSRLFPGIAG